MPSNEDKLNDEKVKEVVKNLINKTHTYINVNLRDTFYGELQYFASELGYIKKLEYPYHNEWVLSNNDVSRCVDELWEYVLIGILAPGSKSSGQGHSFPYLHLTEYGKKIMLEEINPYETNKYVNDMKAIAGNLYDTISELYLLESLKSFKFNCYLASMVLLGGFSEKIFLNFLDDFKSCVQNQVKKSKITKQKFISGKFNEFLTIIKPLKKQLPENIKQNLDLWLNSFFDYVRRTRNKVGHPTGEEMTREKIQAMLMIFPSYIENLVELLNHFKSNPIT